MAATIVQDPVFNEVDDDDGMPPLVDNPYPSMTFTFSAEMTPITYSTDPTGYEVLPDSGNFEQPSIFSPPTSPMLGPDRSTHSKKRDATYIPRPPNAFILFRSSFIRAQHIPGKIEGNHSALSKIIGKYWKALPRDEKEVWEAKAIVAQAEHRRKYPDWRFRPGANALAKVKDGPKKRTNRKGRGEAEKEERSRENRCAKIADLLVAGKKGVDLEVAIEEYDCENGGGPNIKKEGCGVLLMQLEKSVEPSAGPKDAIQTPDSAATSTSTQSTPVDTIPRKLSRSLSPDAAYDVRFKTPLTSMFKRSSSAPASYTRVGAVDSNLPTASPIHHGPEDIIPTTASPVNVITASVLIDSHEGKPRVGSDITDTNTRILDVNQHASSPSVPSSNPLVANFSPSGGIAIQTSWTNTYSPSRSDIDTYSPSLPAFDSDIDDGTSPAQSPITYPFDLNGEGDIPGLITNGCVPHPGIPNVMYGNPQSSYSSLKGWADDTCPKYTTYDYGSLPSPLSSPQSPMVYDPDRVMKDAFAAAATAPYEDWGVAFTTSESYRFASARALQSLQLYAQGWQDIARRQDDGRQLF